MTASRDLSSEIGAQIRRIGGDATFIVRDTLVSRDFRSPSSVRLSNNRLCVYAISVGLTKHSNNGKVVYRGAIGVTNVLLGVAYTQNIQDSYECIILRWVDENGEVFEKSFNMGYFPEDYQNAIVYVQEMFDEAIILPSPTFSEFLRAGTRYYLDLENRVQDSDKPF